MQKTASVVFVCTSRFFGGLELNTLKLASWMTEMGWNILLIVGQDSEMHRKAASMNIPVAGCDRVSKTGKLIYFKRFFRNHKVDILFTPFNKDLTCLSLYKRYFNKKVKLIYQQQMLIGINKRDFIH